MECSICLTDVTDKVILHCSHHFCKKCIYHWLINKPTCPYCRSKVPHSQLIDSYNFGVDIGILFTGVVVKIILNNLEFDEINYINEELGLGYYTGVIPKMGWKLYMKLIIKDPKLMLLFQKCEYKSESCYFLNDDHIKYYLIY
jgi:hypothetical protein